jgi:hypothetical protein
VLALKLPGGAVGDVSLFASGVILQAQRVVLSRPALVLAVGRVFDRLHQVGPNIVGRDRIVAPKYVFFHLFLCCDVSLSTTGMTPRVMERPTPLALFCL